jgi:hypothetical protein
VNGFSAAPSSPLLFEVFDFFIWGLITRNGSRRRV